MSRIAHIAGFIVLLFAACHSRPPIVSELLSYTDTKGRRRPVVTASDWEMKRHQILDSMQAVMGPLPSLQPLPAFDIQYRDSLMTEKYTRYLITFRVADNEYLPAYLYIPARREPRRKFPAMLALHQTGDCELGKQINEGGDCCREVDKNMGYAKELAGRGYVVISPDYPGFGELCGYDFQNDRYQSGTMKGIFNHIRCVDLLQSLPEADSTRIGVIGHSLGGHNALFAGAFDTRIKVVVASCGWTEFEYDDISPADNYGGWAQDYYMPLFRDKFQLDGHQFPFNFHEIIALIAPRRFFSNSPVYDYDFSVEGVKKGMDRAKEAFRFQQAEDRLQVRYPVTVHDFPPDIRREAYRFIDESFDHQP